MVLHCEKCMHVPCIKLNLPHVPPCTSMHPPCLFSLFHLASCFEPDTINTPPSPDPPLRPGRHMPCMCCHVMGRRLCYAVGSGYMPRGSCLICPMHLYAPPCTLNSPTCISCLDLRLAYDRTPPTYASLVDGRASMCSSCITNAADTHKPRCIDAHPLNPLMRCPMHPIDLPCLPSHVCPMLPFILLGT